MQNATATTPPVFASTGAAHAEARTRLSFLFGPMVGGPFAGLWKGSGASALPFNPSAMTQMATMVTAVTRPSIPGLVPGTAYKSNGVQALGRSILVDQAVAALKGDCVRA